MYYSGIDHKIGKMKKILIFQVIVNLLVLVTTLLYTTGKLADIKYNYDEPFADFNNAGRDFHSIVTFYCAGLLVVIVINVVCSSVAYAKYKSRDSDTQVVLDSDEQDLVNSIVL